MAKKNKKQSPTQTLDLMQELTQHYEMWTKDNDKRMTRKNGWNDITDAYWGKLPDDWPYDTNIVDPRIRTSLIEKNGRLLNNKLRGKLVPRESGDTVKARINNAILDFQWDAANEGGSMLMKMGIIDLDTRLYASKFAYVYWHYETDVDGDVVHDGNEMMPLDIRDCGIDPAANHIRDAKWFQLRTWEHLEDLKAQVDAEGNPVFKNLQTLERSIRESMNKKSSKRRDEYVSRVKQLKGLEDRVGEDMAFPVIKIVTEYRRDRWITFAPDHDVVLRDIKNPYDHGKIPIAQNRYYALQDDPLGESEVEPVLPIWRAIQSVICSYMDEVILKMRPPLKIIQNQVQIETIEYGPEAQWLVDTPDAVTEMMGSGETLQYFQTSYQTLVSAFNVAMGDLSAQNTSGLDPFNDDAKTATEVRATQQQQNMRDQKNQNDLGEFIKDVMMMWHSNNQQFLFSDPDKIEHVVRIVGRDQFEQFKRVGMDATDVSPETMETINSIVEQQGGDVPDEELAQMIDMGSMPKHPIVMNPNEKDPTKIRMKPKMRISETGDFAEVSVTPDDLRGVYDYVPDIKSMAVGKAEEMAQARQKAMQTLLDPNVVQLLQQEGYRPNVKELLEDDLEELGLNDAQRYFNKIEQQPQIQAGTGANPQAGGASPAGQQPGLPGAPQANPGAGGPQQMAGPQPNGPAR